MNDCANVVLAAGASPTMARHPEEVEEITAAAAGLVCNLGRWRAGRPCFWRRPDPARWGTRWVLDPVAAGASSLRRRLAARLLDTGAVTVIRGNASEIRALALDARAGDGVDAAPEDLVTGENLARAADLVRNLARRTGAAVVLSGALDLMTDGRRVLAGRNGLPRDGPDHGQRLHALRPYRGLLRGPARPAPGGALAAVSALGVCGERADRRRRANGTGNAAFRSDLIDGVELLTPDILEQEARYDEL